MKTNARRRHGYCVTSWAVGLLLFGVGVWLCWLSGLPARAGWEMTAPETTICGNPGYSAPVLQPPTQEDPTALNPLAGMSLAQVKYAAQTLTPEAASLLSSMDIQFHNLFPTTTLDGPTVETSVTISSPVCTSNMWVQIILPAEMTGEVKFSYTAKSPSSNVDRLQDWIKFRFAAVRGTATAGVGLDGYAAGAYPFTWVVGHRKTILMTQDGFIAVGACSLGGASAFAGEPSTATPSFRALPPEDPAASDPLAGMSLDQVKNAARTLAPEAQQVLDSLDVQFHNLYPVVPLNGPTAEISMTVQSTACVANLWAQIILPTQASGETRFAHAFKAPSSVVERLHDWVRFPFPAVGGTAVAGVGIDGFVEGVYPFTWVVGQGKTVLMTQGGFFSVGACTYGGGSAPASGLPAGTSLDRVGEAAHNLSAEEVRALAATDVQFHNLYPAMTLGGPTVATSVTIQSDMCIDGMWTQIIMPDQMGRATRFVDASKSPASVVESDQDWIKFPFPAIGGLATSSVGLDGFGEGVYPFTWVVGYRDTVLMTRDGFLAVGRCYCTQYSPAFVDVLMGAGQMIYREVEFVNTCNVPMVVDFGFSSPVSEISLAAGHDQIMLGRGERGTVRLYFTTGGTVPTASTQLIAMIGGTEVARVPIGIGPGSAIHPSASLGELGDVNLLPGQIGLYAGTIRNNSDVSLIVNATVPVTSQTWLTVADSPEAAGLGASGQDGPEWHLEPGEEQAIHFALHSAEELLATATVYLESQYGDRQGIPVLVRFGPYADLAISGDALPGEMTPGDAVTVTVTVFNPGPSDALTITVPIEVAGDAIIAGVAVDSGVTCAQGATVTCSAPRLLAGERIAIHVRLEAPVSAMTSGTESLPLVASLRVEVLADTYDPDSSNNVFSAIWGGTPTFLPLVVRD